MLDKIFEQLKKHFAYEKRNSDIEFAVNHFLIFSEKTMDDIDGRKKYFGIKKFNENEDVKKNMDEDTVERFVNAIMKRLFDGEIQENENL